MGVPVLIIGESGSGKTYAVKNLPPEEVAVIFCEKNRLPFKSPLRPIRSDPGSMRRARSSGRPRSCTQP